MSCGGNHTVHIILWTPANCNVHKAGAHKQVYVCKSSHAWNHSIVAFFVICWYISACVVLAKANI